MHSLETEGFRNLQPNKLNLDCVPVVIWGENGQGKSNLLDAAVLGCTGALWRTTKDEEGISWDKEITRVKIGVCGSDEEEINTEVVLARTGKGLLKINGVARRRSDLLGLIPLVGFSSEDIQIIRGEPSRRRRFLNTELSRLDRSYHWNLVHFGRSLEQRNRLLKEIREGKGSPTALSPWNESLARYGAKLIEKRARFLQELAAVSANHLNRLNPGWGSLRLDYQPALGGFNTEEIPEKTVQELQDLLAKGLRQSQGEEVARGFSLVGPHRDDFRLLVGEVHQRTYGSQGEQRCLAIALRLGLVEIVKKAAGESPILILDDIFSELDQSRRRGLLDVLGFEGQFLLTTPEREEIPAGLLEKAQLVQIHKGKIISAGNNQG